MQEEPLITRQDSIASARVGMLWLAAVGDHPISDANWRAYLEQATEIAFDRNVAERTLEGLIRVLNDHARNRATR